MLLPKALSLLALLAIEMPFSLTAANPVKMAAQARFDVSSTTVRLDNAEILDGNGKVERMNWATGEAKNRGYTANFAISHYAWSAFAVRFIPAADGTVELKLMGPWQEASKGVLYQQEVLWDGIRVLGTTIKDGSFERTPSSDNWSGGIVVKANGAFDGSY